MPTECASERFCPFPLKAPPAGEEENQEQQEELEEQGEQVQGISTVRVKKSPYGFVAMFLKRLRIFRPNFTGLLSIPIYARVQILIQLYSTTTKLCHIKCDHPACASVDGGHFEHIMVVALNMA